MWLCTSIVELLGHHERGYLEHCRLWPPLAAKGRARARGKKLRPLGAGHHRTLQAK